MKFNLNTENVNYVKINYTDKNGFAHCIKAAVRLIGEIEFLACAKIEEDLNIEVPQEVSLGIACENGLYKAKTTLKKIEKEPPFLLFSMRKPEDMEYQQKREYFRVKLQENANIIYENNGKEVKISAITYDISANGVRIELDSDISFPEQVRLLLSLPERTIDVKAKYIRSDKEDEILKASFQFADMLQQDSDYISQMCLRKQLEERRKNLM